MDGEGLAKMLEGLFAETEFASKIGKDMKDTELSVECYISYAIYPDTGQVESMYFEKSIFVNKILKRTYSFNISPLTE